MKLYRAAVIALGQLSRTNSRPLARPGGRYEPSSVPSAGAQRRLRSQRPWFRSRSWFR